MRSGRTKLVNINVTYLHTNLYKFEIGIVGLILKLKVLSKKVSGHFYRPIA